MGFPEVSEILAQLFHTCSIFEQTPGTSPRDFWNKGNWSPVFCHTKKAEDVWVFTFSVVSPSGADFHCQIEAEDQEDFAYKVAFGDYFDKKLAAVEAARKIKVADLNQILTEANDAEALFFSMAQIGVMA